MLELIVIVIVIGGVVLWRRRSRPLPPARWENPRAAAPDQLVPRRIGPESLTGELRELSRQALSELTAVMGSADNPRLEQTYFRVADLLAALRFYRTAVTPAFTDDLIEAGLGDPQRFIHGFIDAYRKLPPSTDRDQAIDILVYLDSSEGAGVIVGMARLTIVKLRDLGR